MSMEQDSISEAPSEETQDAPVDWEARVKELEAANAKLVNDAKANSGRARQAREAERDATLRELLDEVSGLRKVSNALISRTATGETDALTDDLAAIDQESATTRAGRALEQGRADMAAQLEEILRDEDGNLLVDADSDEFATLRESWRGAKTIGDMSEVVIDATKIVRKIERAKLKQAREEEQKASKARETKAGVHDLSAGSPATGSGSGMSWDQAQKIKNISEISAADYERLIAG